MTPISEAKKSAWHPPTQTSRLLNATIWASKKFASNLSVAVVAATIPIFWKKYCSTLYSFAIPSPTSLIPFCAMLAYNMFEDREIIYKVCVLVKDYFNCNYNKKFTDLAIVEIKKELSSKIGKKWLENRCFTLDQGIQYLTQICLKDNGICDGAVLAFLHIIHQDNTASLKDSEIESRITLFDSIKYQVRRELKIDVKNHHLLDLLDMNLEQQADTFEVAIDKNALLECCKEYDPYHFFEKYCIYRQPAGKRAINTVFTDINQYGQDNLKNDREILVGRINYSGGATMGHAISVQFNLGHYRYRDAYIRSFSSFDELMSDLYDRSCHYFKDYDQIEVRLWKLPYIHSNQ